MVNAMQSVSGLGCIAVGFRASPPGRGFDNEIARSVEFQGSAGFESSRAVSSVGRAADS
jgi:hypothetical protein